jgi:polysaccharide pyruvyl transferase WcaK-like protein
MIDLRTVHDTGTVAHQGLGGVALLNPSGWGNLGDSAIVDSAIRAVRRRRPEARIVGLTLNPADTAKRHGIPAFTCSGFTFGDYCVTEGVPAAVPGQPTDRIAPGPGIGASHEARNLRAALRRLARMAPGLPQAWAAARIVRADVRHRRLLAQAARRFDFIVVAGGGQLDDFWGGSFAHPYVLWRWAQQARAEKSRFVVLSVGTGNLETALARAFVRSALAAADYRSFRDEGSRALVADPRFSADPVVPDLAYGLPMQSWRRARRADRQRPVIGLSPIAYCDPRVWPRRDQERYDSYVARLAELAASLLAAEHDLLFFGTDGPDNTSIVDLRRALAQRVSTDLLSRTETRTLESHEQLFEALSGVDAVVASRLHGVLLTHLMGIPALALSYERKVRTLMKAMAQEEHCLEIESFDPAVGFARVRELLARRQPVSEDIVQRVNRFKGAVDAQYDRIFGAAVD